MAKKHRFRISNNPFESRSMPRESSTMEPLPYFPNLRRALASHGAALLLIYLELYFPDPQDSKESPVVVDIARVRLDLQLGDWVVWKYFSFIGTRFQSAVARSAAQMAGREFYRADRRWGIGALKCYSLTTAGHGIYTLKRNHLQLHSLLSAAGCEAQLSAWRKPQTGGPVERKTDSDGQIIDRKRLLSAQLDDAIARRPEVVAAAVARSLNQISKLGDGRRRAGLKREKHTRRPWTEERRAKFKATMARKKGNDVCSSGPLE